MADTTIPAEASAQMIAYQDYIDPSKTYSEAVEENATAMLATLNADPAVDHINYADLVAAAVYVPEDDGSGEGPAAETVSTTNFVNNNKVVVVSYGDVDDERVKTYYKSFLLNYNNFAVRTYYNGGEYTIPAYGYVVLYH